MIGFCILLLFLLPAIALTTLIISWVGSAIAVFGDIIIGGLILFVFYKMFFRKK
jgi:hypothetical protein